MIRSDLPDDVLKILDDAAELYNLSVELEKKEKILSKKKEELDKANNVLINYVDEFDKEHEEKFTKNFIGKAPATNLFGKVKSKEEQDAYDYRVKTSKDEYLKHFEAERTALINKANEEKKELISKPLEEYNKVLDEYNNFKKQIDDFDTLIPVIYRQSIPLVWINNSIVWRRADTLKEAINIYEAEKARTEDKKNREQLVKNLAKVIDNAIHEVYDNGYNKGHEVGYSEGYDEGYSDGYRGGRNSGYQEGYNEGLAEEVPAYENRDYDKSGGGAY